MQYAARITKEGKYTLAEFPDCPGCQTFAEPGESIEQRAREALAGWLESHLGRDLVPPRPRRRRSRPGIRYLLVSVPAPLAVRLALRWAREEAGLTQAELAKKLHISQQQIQRLEAPNANPTIATLEKVAQGLGRDLHVVLT